MKAIKLLAAAIGILMLIGCITPLRKSKERTVTPAKREELHQPKIETKTSNDLNIYQSDEDVAQIPPELRGRIIWGGTD